MKSIYWLASYPKSGNTWLRAFLANYIFNQPTPVPINRLHKLGAGDSNALAFQQVLRREIDPRSPAESAMNRAPFFDAIVANGADINFVKTHTSNDEAFGVPLIPVQHTKCAFYIVRDPRDLVLSYASHHGLSIDLAIEELNNPNNAIAGDTRSTHQFLGRWSDHVIGWTRAKKFPVLTLRYEDMLARPEKTFASVVRRIPNMPLDKDRLNRAIHFSSFEQLKSQETESGFIENSKYQEKFFRTGGAGHYKSHLSERQIAKIEHDNFKGMRRFGYL